MRMSRWRALVLVGGVWLGAAVIVAVRLRARGGVFGEAVGLGESIAAQAVLGLPWVLAGAIAWWAAGRWPLTRDEMLRPITIQCWIGLLVVVGQQILSTGLSALLPLGQRPLDPWSRLPEHLTYRGPAALVVYLVVAAACLALRSGPTSGQDAPAAGSDESP